LGLNKTHLIFTKTNFHHSNFTESQKSLEPHEIR